jgi:flagellin-specific chaperone FliS
MMSHRLYTSKYQSQATQFSNVASIVVALCEKAISCISTAMDAHKNDDKSRWYSNLGTVQEIINVISTTLVVEKEDKTIIEMRKFYQQLSLYTSALIAGSIDAAKAQDLLESFRITRNTWKNVEQQYIQMEGAGDIQIDGVI